MGFRKQQEEYDWLNDPFDEKKIARDKEQARTSSGMKVALGCGCLLVVVALVAMLFFGAASFVSILS
ncbi:MAG: hypothetical protein U0M72_01775 [Eggerthellaceae bacterium]